jgi:hypothetical protein
MVDARQSTQDERAIFVYERRKVRHGAQRYQVEQVLVAQWS